MRSLSVFFVLSIIASSVLSCSLTPGLAGIDTELRIAKLESEVKSLSQKLALADAKLVRVEAGQTVTDKVTKECIKRNSKHWALQRVDAVFPSLTKIQLHQKTPTYTEKLPYNVPADTRAILISIYCNFWNNNGHAYFNADIHQKDNSDKGIAKVMNTHYNVYANTFYYEIMLPWNSDLPAEVIFKVRSTYQTGGANNWYQVKMVGFITD